MQLDEHLKTKVRFHLGINTGAQIPAGDRARLEEAMCMVPDDYWYKQIVNHIRRCDKAWEVSEYFQEDGVNFSRLEEIAGDVNVQLEHLTHLKAMNTIGKFTYVNVTDWLKRFTLLTIAVLKYDAMRLTALGQSSLWQYLVQQIQA